MDRTGYVIRTPKGDKGKNKLRLPEFGVSFLQLKAGSKVSAAHVPSRATAGGEAGSDDFNFLPEHETIEIRYHINSPTAVVKEARLELFTRFETTPLWTLNLHDLGESWLRHGKHLVKWDGRIVNTSKKLEGKYDKGKKEWNHDLTKLDVDKSIGHFPDGYATLAHTPYKVKLSLVSLDTEIKGTPSTGWTFFQILVKKIELELGEEDAIPAARVDDDRHKLDKAVRTRIESDGRLPTGTAVRKVMLVSNTFRETLGQMNGDELFDDYSRMWGDGPNIPIFAKVRMADSAGSEVKIDESAKGAVALGRAQFLWNWEDVKEDVDAQQNTTEPKDFIKESIEYFRDGTDRARRRKDHTYPTGDNCHVDRGGKRGPDARPVFPNQAGYAPKTTLDKGQFPFKVIATGTGALKNRRWASLSEGWTSGALKGKTGVVFQPSRMAGDGYKVTVYLAYDKAKKDEYTLDDRAEPLSAPDAIKATTGTFQIWREVHLARYVHKDGLPAPLLPAALNNVRTHFNRAYVEIENKMGSDHAYALSDHRKADSSNPDYDALVKARLAATRNRLFTRNLATAATFDHASVSSMVKVRTYAEFVQAVHLNRNSGVAAAANDIHNMATAFAMTDFDMAEAIGGFDGSMFNTSDAGEARLRRTRNWLNSNNVENYDEYSHRLSDLCFGFDDQLCTSLELIHGKKSGKSAAPEGVATIEFDFTHTFIKWIVQTSGRGYSWCWYGKVVDTGDTDEKHSLIMFWEREGTSGREKWAHEFGHNCYLPHAPDEHDNRPDGTRRNRHDKDDGKCLMSYNNTRHGFCGLCQLRMRGWPASELNRDSARNTRP